MPTTYAHYRFGCRAFSLFPKQLQCIIENNRELFDFGVHGPDLLFYHSPYMKNTVNRLGYASHERSGYDFFSQAAKTVNSFDNRDAALSYAMGVLCHYTLDSVCHPYVGEKEKTGVSHSLIEASYDRSLMLQDGIDPLTYPITKHLHPSDFSAVVISTFYPPLGRKDILTAEKSMVFWLNLLNTTSGRKRNLLEQSMKTLRQDGFLDLLTLTKDVPECNDSDRILTELFDQALELIPELAEQFLSLLEQGTPLGERFEHTFGED